MGCDSVVTLENNVVVCVYRALKVKWNDTIGLHAAASSINLNTYSLRYDVIMTCKCLTFSNADAFIRFQFIILYWEQSVTVRWPSVEVTAVTEPHTSNDVAAVPEGRLAHLGGPIHLGGRLAAGNLWPTNTLHGDSVKSDLLVSWPAAAARTARRIQSRAVWAVGAAEVLTLPCRCEAMAPAFRSP